MINLMGLHNNVSITISNLDASGISLASASLARFQVIAFVSEKNESRHFLFFADSEIANNVWEKFKKIQLQGHPCIQLGLHHHHLVISSFIV